MCPSRSVELATIPCWRAGSTVCTVAVLAQNNTPAVFETRARVGMRQVYARIHPTQQDAVDDANVLRADFAVR